MHHADEIVDMDERYKARINYSVYPTITLLYEEKLVGQKNFMFPLFRRWRMARWIEREADQHQKMLRRLKGGA